MAVTSLKNEFFRKLIHLSSIWMVVFIYLTETSVSILFFLGLLIVFFGFEYSRMAYKPFAVFMNRYFGFVMRSNEQVTRFEWRALTGSFYFILSVLLSLLLFSKSIAITAILIMIFADTFAALIGKSIGRHQILWFHKSIEGCIAFFLITIILLMTMASPLPIPHILIIGLVTTLVELVSNRIHVNDNLSITLSSGALISFAYHCTLP